MWFATVADGVFPAGNTPPAVSIKPFLLETFGAWHEPISNLLRSTRDEDILCEDARAMSARGLRLVASSRYADSPSVERGERGQQWRSSVVLVGDAAHMVKRGTVRTAIKLWGAGASGPVPPLVECPCRYPFSFVSSFLFCLFFL